MSQKKHHILITRPLSDQQRSYAQSLGLNPIEKPALTFEFDFNHDQVLKTIGENLQARWVFTSQNGVKALEKLMNKRLKVSTNKQIFAVGSKTQQALQNLGLNAKIPKQHDGYHMAELIIDKNIDSVIHFHGNLSRKDMRDKLVDNRIEVAELEVYQTIIHPIKLPSEPVEAVLFYSPSAVKGFKQGQGFDEPLPQLFAIGPTTAKALQNETNQPVQAADQPNTKTLLRAVSTWLHQKKEL